MKRAYLAISLSLRTTLDPVVKTIQQVLAEHGIELFVFVDHYHFSPHQEKEMMQQALIEIDRCGLLIAECSEKAIGVGLEAGYAIGRGKQLWYLRPQNAPHSTTVAGAAHKSFIYGNTGDLADQIRKELHTAI
ncbi:nucleoside 2-deoxyribosyltransferase [Sediminibacterium sp.]|jgi:2'-deoxynucleoside 5'-phosphate N-hydrolase|uniref:nucleoside 2-deoxyribosyltransferase n=1 Tax=Sediminibacterium sp. TaxID=1917865 RepID=UPI0025D51F56|nr:nucleoside 2-deoxyribosyltransferase [Sediminibacterium sp.]MBW0177192.1 nucleoside 2-deoxyribosyltransferase [Sediminibacterium sp.]